MGTGRSDGTLRGVGVIPKTFSEVERGVERHVDLRILRHALRIDDGDHVARGEDHRNID